MGSRSLMGETWLPAFLEAPVWRFSLPPGMCSQWAAIGLMLPSVDRAGRYFPLMFAALRSRRIDAAGGEPWLGVCEAAGRAALEQDKSPDDVAAMIGEPELRVDENGAAEAEWWTEGSVRVRPSRMRLRCMPDSATYAAMLGAGERDRSRGDDMGVDVMMTPRFRSWAVTHVGTVRKHNEDAYVDRPDQGIWAVADGAGGHSAGEVASGMIAEALQAIPPGLSGAGTAGAGPAGAGATPIARCVRKRRGVGRRRSSRPPWW